MKSFKRWFNTILMSTAGITLMLMPLSPSVLALDADNSAVSGPTILNKINGQYNTSGNEPSPVIAVNQTRVFELLNNQYYIFTRGGSGISGTAQAIAHTGNLYLTDPQVMWDPISSRFYYSYIEQNGSMQNGINWGFSKTADPNSAADFCSYFNSFNYGTSTTPDKDSLGDNRTYLFFASERVVPGEDGAQYGSDIAWASKPPAGPSCPAQTSFKEGIQSLSSTPASGSETDNQPTGYPYYPVVAKQVDENPTSWIVGLPSYTSANYLNVTQVSTGSNGLPVIGQTRNLLVPNYSAEGYGLHGVQGDIVPQGGSNYQGGLAPNLNVWITLNGMYMAFDPRLDHYSLWTTDTIAGGTPTETAVRWYEIFPGNNTVDQTGTISSPTLDYFNSAIAPDRAVVYGTGAKYGSDMAITFNSSSASTDPAMYYVAKKGALAATAPVLIKQSLGTYSVNNCTPPSAPNTPETCRYGDWPGAAPDPLTVSNNISSGRVWLSNEWNIAPNSYGDPIWRSELAEIGF